MTTVTLLYFDGCPNWHRTDEDLRVLTDEFGLQYERRRIETPEEADRVGFRGSPSVLVDGRDPFAVGDEPVGLACRVYPGPDGPRGRPTRDELRQVLST